MDRENRRKEIIRILQTSARPLAGSELSELFHVSRQVIVQDIALLRSSNYHIISTSRGYLLTDDMPERKRAKRVFKVKHTDKEILDELFTIVDCGGYILDVIVDHHIYGQIIVDLIINNRQDAQSFVDNVTANKIKPLNDLTYGEHFHTVEANGIEVLNRVEERLRQKGYLIN